VFGHEVAKECIEADGISALKLMILCLTAEA
jgi:hypothetical protein